MAVSLNTAIFDQLNSSEARALHDDSDALSACGVGRIVNLPQIVVVGDESAGKSSVLEALSHVRFPIEAGICTRFATELVLRQSSQTRVSVSIKFADSSKTTHNLQRNDFSAEDLPDIIKDARACMGFPGSKQGFSKDVLRLEIEGPGMYPITLVDMPGLFHAETETQTLEDKKTVDQLVESYMKQKNSIMLVVLAADRPASGQVALTKVKEMDPTRQRTLGVITKPDRVKAMGGDEATVIRLANNQEAVNKLKLGWHVLRNRAEGEASLDERDEVEKRFFESGTWATIPKQNVGIENFRKKLSSVCFEHLRASLPAVVQDIEREIHLRQEELNQLGQGRATMEDQRTYLLSIAGDFQKLARDGIYGRYHESFFGDLDDEERKFRAQLRNFNRVFDYTMRTKGCERRIVSYASDDDEDDEDEDGDEDEDEDDEDDDLPELPEYLETFMEKYPYDFPRPKASSQPALRRELQRQASANQGREFPGSPNQELAIQLFRKQASPWKRIAEFHIDNVMTVAKAFVDELFTHLMGSPRTNKTTERVLTTIVDPFFAEKEQILKDKLSEFLCPYDQGFALPLDVDLHEELEEQSLSRMAGKLFRALSETHPDVFEKDARGGLTKETLAKTVTTNSHMWTDEFATEKVLDMMLAYYETSRRTFTDNIVNLVLESCLVRDIPEILTPTKVGGMDQDRLAEIAAESDDSRSHRKTLHSDLEILRKGLVLCRRHKPRPVTSRQPMPQQSPDVVSPPDRSVDKSSNPNIAQPKASDSRGSEAKTVTQPSVSNGVTGAPNLGSAKPTQGSVLEGGLFNKGSTPLPGAGLFGSVTQTSTYEKPPTGGSFTFGNPSSTSTQPTTKSLFGANTFNQTSGQPPIFGTSAGSSSTKAPAQDTGRSLFNRGTSDSKK